MRSKKTVISKDPKRPIYQNGPWFVQVNHHLCKPTAAITSGDVWYPISRQEAAQFLRQKW